MIQTIMKLVQTDIAVIVYEVIVIVVLIIILTVILRKKSNKKKVHSAVQEKLRDDKLRNTLENKYAAEELKTEAIKNVPYEVNYHEEVNCSIQTVSIQIIEKTLLSTRKYIFQVEMGGKCKRNI